MRAGSSKLWWQGALHVELRGDAVDVVITQLQQSGRTLHRIRVREHRGTLIIALRDFSALYTLCRRHHVRIRFIERIGFVFWLRRLSGRKSMVVGPALFVLIICLASSMLWQVTVTGVSEDTRGALREAAAQSGITVGAWKGSIADLAVVQDRILSKLPNLVWVGASITGGKANLEAIEKVPGVPGKPKSPQDIVAGKPAVILHVYATRGKVLVQPGQVVHPGQVLVTGNLGEDGTQVPAQAEVFAEVWYTSQVTMPLAVAQQGLTGDYVTKDYLTVGSLQLRIWGWKAQHFAQSVNQVKETDWHLGNLRLPFQYRQVKVAQTTKTALLQSRKKASERAPVLALQDVQGRMGEDGTVLAQRVLHQEVSHGKLYETILTKVEQDIGVGKPIPEAITPKQKDDGKIR